VIIGVMFRFRSGSLSWLPLMLIIAIGGCSSKPPAAKLEAGWTEAKNATEGVSMGMPPGWTSMGLENADVSKVMDEASKLNPQFGAAANMVKNLPHNVKYALLVFDPTGKGNATVQIIVEDVGRNVSVKEASAANAKTMRMLNVQNVREEEIDLPVGPSGKFTYDLTANAVDGQQHSNHATCYTLVRGTKIYSVTMMSFSDRASELEPVYKKMIESLRFTD
jgi:hypothetical protein